MFLLVPFLGFGMYAHIGFPGTDEGFILAYARRLLDGQIPHVDFIHVRPPGSSLLHAPALIFGGEHTFLFSRFIVLLEMSLAAWAWVGLLEKLESIRFQIWSRLGFALLAFAVTLGSFPLMSWHTIDGVFLVSLGLRLAVSRREGIVLIGYGLVGAAFLCKQNFGACVPIALVVLGGWRDWRKVVASAAPAAVYFLFMVMVGGFRDMVEQLFAVGGLGQIGFVTYFDSTYMWWGIGAGLVFSVLSRLPWNIIADLALIALVGFALWSIQVTPQSEIGVWSFGLFGALIGSAALNPSRRSLWLALGIAWTSSISVGANTPALAMGPMLVAFLAAHHTARPVVDGSVGRRLPTALILAALALVSVHRIRTTYSYRDALPLVQVEGLGESLAGAAGVHTGPDHVALYADLRAVVDQIRPAPYVILPELPGWWVRAPESNPLLLDWHYFLELKSPALNHRAIERLEETRGTAVIVMNYGDEAFVTREYYPILAHVRNGRSVVRRTRFFTVYR